MPTSRDEVIRSTTEETRANRRASSAKLRWAVRDERLSVMSAQRHE